MYPRINVVYVEHLNIYCCPVLDTSVFITFTGHCQNHFLLLSLFDGKNLHDTLIYHSGSSRSLQMARSNPKLRLENEDINLRDFAETKPSFPALASQLLPCAQEVSKDENFSLLPVSLDVSVHRSGRIRS